jgi:predicted DNA-binding transcriptional regulator YafY
MRRADRLFQIVQLIRGRRLTTAQWLAQRLEVSERTVYRDVADLQYQGVPIEGEAGVGYRLGQGFELPPLMFTVEEASALVATTRLAQQWLDPALARASESALSRVMSVLSAAQRQQAQSLAVYATPFGLPKFIRLRLQLLREAVQQRRKVIFKYGDAQQRQSERCVSPLGCFFWGDGWALVAWCDMREDFRTFRIDRIIDAHLTDQTFDPEHSQSLPTYLQRHGIKLEDL